MEYKTEKNSEIILETNNQKKTKTCIHSDVSKYLKTHQIDGIRFLFENCYQQNSGCILAHCMGLGKTLQVIGLLHTVINSKDYGTNKILVLCPVSTIMNWKEEILRWLGPIDDGHRKLQILELEQKDHIERKISFLQNWSQCDSESAAVCLIMGYESFRNLVNFHTTKANAKKFKESSLRQIRARIQKYLLAPPDIVICDEGHAIKNSTAATTLAVNQIQTKRRIVLTGTPMQNHLMEYYSMVDFVKPNFLGSKQHFNEYFAEPIKAGQHADSCETDIKYMKQRSYALNKKLSTIVQRREISLLKDFLPEKFEFVLFVPLTQIQYDLYKYFLENRGGVIEVKRLFGDYTCLRKIWTHLKVLDNAHQKSVAKKRRTTKNDDDDSNDDDADEEYAPSGRLQMVDNDWWRKVIDKTQIEEASSSHKMIILFEILNECKRVGDKCVIFSSFVEVLNVVEFFMQQIDQRTGKGGLENFVGPWRKNEDYYRLDGSTPKDRRHAMIKNFNDANNKRVKTFLISSQAGGQGINLFGANRLVLLDTSWNPSKDQQNIYRIYRMGQTKQCYIYRLLSMGTMEEKIYSRSVTKQAMSCRVVDKQQIDRHYSMNELHELYSLTETDMRQRVAPIPPKDNLLAHLLGKYPHMIFKYLEHDSLLANKVEEELNDIEKNEAWQRCQEQNVQMQALNNLMSNGQQTVTPFKLHDEIAPVLELKERSTVNMGKKAVYSQPNKEITSFCMEMRSYTSGNAISKEPVHLEPKLTSLSNDQAQTSDSKWLPASNEMPTDVESSNDVKPRPLLPLEKVESGCDDVNDDDFKMEDKGPLLAIVKDIFEQDPNGPSSTKSEMEHKYSADKSSSVSDDDQMDAQMSLKRSESYEWLPASNEIATAVESSNEIKPGPLVQSGCDERIEGGDKGPLLAIAKDIFEPILNGRSSTNNEMEYEHSEDELSSIYQQMDVHTPLQRSTSYEWLPASNANVAESSNDDKSGSLSPLENFEYDCDDSIEVGDEGPLLEIVKDIIEPIMNLASSTNSEIEHEDAEDKSSSVSNDQLKRSESNEWLPASKEMSTDMESSNYAKPGALEKFENCCGDGIEVGDKEPLLAFARDIFEPILNGPSSTNNEMGYEYSEDELNSICQQMDVHTPLQRSTSYEWLPASNANVAESSNDNGRAELVQLQNAHSEDNYEEAESSAVTKDIFEPSGFSNELTQSRPDVQQIDAQPSQERPKSCARLAESNGTLIESSTDGNQRVLLSLENVNKGRNDSLSHDSEGLLMPLENVRKGTSSDSLKDNGSDYAGSQRMNAQTCLERSDACQWPADSSTTSIDDTQEVLLPLGNVINGRNNSSKRYIQRRPSQIENRDSMEGSVERSLSEFVKGLLNTLNNQYASSQQPCTMEDYAIEERIIHPNEVNNLEYRIALKRPSNSTIQRPIKRLKLSLEIDPMAAVDHITSMLPLTTVCQLNAIMENPHSLNAENGSVRFSNLNGEDNTSEDEDVFPNGAQQSKELVADLPPTESAEDYFNEDIEADEIIATTIGYEGMKSNCVRVESTFPVDNEDDEEMSPNESTERINLNDLSHSGEPPEDGLMSSSESMEEEEEVSSTYSTGRIDCTQYGIEQDSPAGMSESETSDTEDLDDTHSYQGQPSTMSMIKDRCALM